MKRWLAKIGCGAIEWWLDRVEPHVAWLDRVHSQLYAIAHPTRQFADPLYPTETYARACRQQREEGE